MARSQRQAPTAKVQLEIQESQRSGMLVASADAIGFSYGDKQVFRDFSCNIMRGDKIGIMGRNGAGKTTLLRVLLGQLPPELGSVRLGTNLQIAYFDQLRQQLHEERSVQENVDDGYESVEINGRPRHIIGYLQDFLFSSERARTPVRFLSGGERNRVLLAKLFAKPANVIVLDEPTNDLDAETLELLEERLVQFEGTVLLVSHDRTFLNNVVTSTIVFEDAGVREYVGGYDDWLRQRAARSTNFPPLKSRSIAKSFRSPQRVTSQESSKQIIADDNRKRRPSFKERQERNSLPALIEQLESDIAALHVEMTQPQYYRQSGQSIAEGAARLRQLENQLTSAYVRWEDLDQLAE